MFLLPNLGSPQMTTKSYRGHSVAIQGQQRLIVASKGFGPTHIKTVSI